MVQQIDLYADGRKQFPTLVNELDAGIRGLLDTYSDIRDSLRDEWRVLEEVNALALDEGSLVPLGEHQDLAERALNQFVALSKGRLGID
jgi:hypothetical protein